MYVCSLADLDNGLTVGCRALLSMQETYAAYHSEMRFGDALMR